MRRGLLILNLMSVVWCAIAVIGTGASPAWLAPAAVLAAATAWAGRGLPDRTDPADRRRIGRLVGLWSAAEGVAAFLAANILINLGHADAFVPTLAIIVGLHFVPLARGLPMRLYYATGAALLLVGAAGLAVPPSSRTIFVCVAAAAVLWATSLALIAAARDGVRSTV